MRADSARAIVGHLFGVVASTSTKENASEFWDLRGQSNSGFSYTNVEVDLIVIGTLNPLGPRDFQRSALLDTLDSTSESGVLSVVFLAEGLLLR